MHSEDTEKWPAVGSIRTKVAHASQQARRHVLATASWARRQPRSRLFTTAVIIAVTALATWAALALLVSILGYWFGGTEAPPAPPAPPPAPPMWFTELTHIGLWKHLTGSLHAFATQHAPTVGMPAWLLLTIWAGIGGMLLLGTWGQRPRSILGGAYWAAWLVATAWAIWIHTPGGSPVPAALAAGLGLALGTSVWFLPLIAVFVAISFLPLA